VGEDWRCGRERTRGKRLLELLGLVGVLENESVDVPRAADLELDVVDLLVLLDARGCMVVSFTLNYVQLSCQRNACSYLQPQIQAYAPLCFRTASCRLRLPKVFPPLLWLHCIALCGASGATRTLGVLAAADLDELLDIGNFGRHFGGGGWSSREKSQGSLEVRKGSRRPNRCGLA
jgi:hypothetical protein